MKILFVITSLRNGGAEHLVAELLSRLKAQGQDMELIVFDGTTTSTFECILKDGIKVHILGKGALNMWNPFHILKLRNIIKQGNYDIVHTHNSPAQILTSLAGVKKLSKLVTTEHNTTNRRRGKWWGNILDKRVYSAYNHIVCVSEQTKDNLEKHIEIEPKRISVIPNGVDTMKFSNSSTESYSKNIPSADVGSKIIFMAGAFRKQKDQQTLIRAMRHLPDNFILWLAGGWILRKECEKLCSDLGITDRVLFLGERDDIPELLKRADIVALSSHYEGMSLSAIECMASGKPFIASKVPGIIEIAENAAILVPEGDDEAWAKAILQISVNQMIAADIVKKCKERAKKFDIKKTLDAHLNLYKNLCK